MTLKMTYSASCANFSAAELFSERNCIPPQVTNVHREFFIGEEVPLAPEESVVSLMLRPEICVLVQRQIEPTQPFFSVLGVLLARKRPRLLDRPSTNDAAPRHSNLHLVIMLLEQLKDSRKKKGRRQTSGMKCENMSVSEIQRKNIEKKSKLQRVIRSITRGARVVRIAFHRFTRTDSVVCGK